MTSQLTSIATCEVCANTRLTSVLDLGTHPMCDDLVEIGEARVCRKYPIEILFCDICRTAHQRFQIPKADLFPKSYHYRSRFTADVLAGMSSLVDSCERMFGSLAGKRVLDIGCNDGSLLDFFAAKHAITIGIEPTGAYEDAHAKGHAAYNAFLSEQLAAAVVEAHGKPDFIVFTNVFAHIEDLHEVLRSLRVMIAPTTVIVIENHYLGAVLDGNQFDTFYHEHPRTYSYTSFVHIARALGMALSNVQFPRRYGGNIRIFLGGNPAVGTDAVDLVALDERESHFEERFEQLRCNLTRWRKIKGKLIGDLVRQYGRLRAKAFPGRAAILVKLLGLDEQSLASVHEKPGSMKIGHYLPGTRVPIRSDEELFAVPDEASPLLNLAWHIPREIRDYLEANTCRRPVIDIINAEDFEVTEGAASGTDRWTGS